jgi:hypothetical protein
MQEDKASPEMSEGQNRPPSAFVRFHHLAHGTFVNGHPAMSPLTALQLLRFRRKQKTPAPKFFHVGTSIQTQPQAQTQKSSP